MRDYSLRRQILLFSVIFALSILFGTWAYANRPKDIHVNLDGEEMEIRTEEDTLRQALIEAGYSNLDQAHSSIDLDATLEDGMEATVETKKTIRFRDGKESETYTSYAGTVGEFLEEVDADYDQDDEIEPARMGKLEDGMKVSLDHIDHRVEEETEEIPFEVESRKSDKLYQGKTKVDQEGKPGQLTITSERVYKNGDLVEETQLSKEVTSQPVTKIVLEGTKKAPAAVANSSSTYSLSQFMHKGVINWGGYRYTYYSQSVLPGSGLRIPGRHVNGAGYVCDGDGFIVLAGSAPKGTVYPTPFGGAGKIYDRGTVGNHLDVYIR